jgi:hypothetical protein
MTEWSLPVGDLDRAVSVWEALGFRLAALHADPHPRALLSVGEDIAVGLHERPALRHAALSYTCPRLDEAMSHFLDQGLHLEPARSPVNEGPSFQLVSPEGLRILLSPGS